MIEIRGKFITLVASLMRLYKDSFEKADSKLYAETGRHWNELEPECWYDIKHYTNFAYTYRDSSPSKDNALITLGKQIYPTIYMGIMKMAGVMRGKIYQEKCIKNGDKCCEFHIIWNSQ